MQLASEAGIAPPLRYADAKAGVAIMDYVVELPLQRYPGGAAILARDIAALVSKLHATGLFPGIGDFRQLIRSMLTHLQAGFARGLLDAHMEGFEGIVAAYPWNPAAHVSCHNDPNPRNTLFDGKRLWLIEANSGFAGDEHCAWKDVFGRVRIGAPRFALRRVVGQCVGTRMTHLRRVEP
jgi:hypothetical protein